MGSLPETVAESLREEILVIGRDMKILWANKAARETYGQSLIGEPCYWVTHRLKHSCREPMHVCPLYEVLESGQPCSVTHLHTGADGQQMHMEITVHPLEWEGGTAFLHMARDVTDRIRQGELQEEMWIEIIGQMERIFAELANSQADLETYTARLKESEERYRDLYENASVGLYRTRIADGCVLMVNGDWARLMGYEDERAAMGTSVCERYAEPEKYHEFLRLLHDRGEVRQHEMEVARPDGSRATLCVSGRIYPDAGYIEGAAIDITQRRQMEKALAQSDKLRALGEMASGVAHDFNNILASIIANVQLLRRNGRVDPETEKRLGLIEVAAKDGAQTIRRIQEFSRLRKDRDFQRLNLNQLVEEVVLITQPRWKDQSQRLGRTITLETQLQPLPPMAGNAAEIKEILTNLIFNAVDAMPGGGGMTIQTWSGDGAGNGAGDGAIHLTFSDTGKGMPANVRRKVFDPFFTTKGVTNSGLGLSVSYGIIRRHGGSIEVESEEGQGTTFSLEFPVSDAPEEDRAAPSEQAVSAPKASILLVDDEPMVLETLIEVLSSEGHECTGVTNGKEALARFREGRYDIVLTDLGMPEMSGWEVAAAVKRLSPTTPVAMITGWGVEFDREQLASRGVDLVLAKPFDCTQVAGLVSKALGPKGSGPSGPPLPLEEARVEGVHPPN
jgi:PAS domain S-box-containing protein